MGALIDTCVWIDFFHVKTPPALRSLAADQINREDALLCEPVFAEIFHGLSASKAGRVLAHMNTMPMLPTPASLWRDAAELIRICTGKGRPVGTMDAVIAAIAKRTDSTIVSFDGGLAPFHEHCGVKLLLLKHPA
jgi:predicted nucleic acid-binding protein